MFMSVPVISYNNKPLFPCKERRARCLMRDGRASPHYQKGIFCIKLTRKESDQREPYPELALGIDPGSKREGYTVLTKKSVVLNITTDTKNWVKDHVETRRNLRRTRRSRNTPYRKCRSNRLRNKNHIPPSTKTRWNTKLLFIKFLMSILPISIINVEDVCAKTLKGKKRWNTSFSPLEVGKKWFYSEIQKLGIKFILTQGYDTKLARDYRNFVKSKKKLEYTWEAHNVDSHILAELALNKQVNAYYGLWKVEFLEYHRRVLHRQNPTIGGIRTLYGGTVSMGIPRGSVAKYRGRLCYIGGTSKNRVSIHNILTGTRISQRVKVDELNVMYKSNRRVQFLPWLNPGVSLHI
jgi:RRXRR protein